MTDAARFQRLAALAALTSSVLMLASIGLSSAAFGLGGGLRNARDLYYSVLSAGPASGYLLHLSMVADMLGYYLLLLPVALFLQRWLGRRSPNLAAVYTLAAVAYAIFGAIGAATLSALLPPLVNEYAHASAQQRQVLQEVYRAGVNAVYGGIWNTLEMIPFGTWLIGMGMLLRTYRPRLGLVLTACGAAGLCDALGFTLGLEAAAVTVLYPLLLLLPIAIAWLGLVLLRDSGISLDARV
jgi:Domain of unknown function (DUF4386)